LSPIFHAPFLHERNLHDRERYSFVLIFNDAVLYSKVNRKNKNITLWCKNDIRLKVSKLQKQKEKWTTGSQYYAAAYENRREDHDKRGSGSGILQITKQAIISKDW